MMRHFIFFLLLLSFFLSTKASISRLSQIHIQFWSQNLFLKYIRKEQNYTILTLSIVFVLMFQIKKKTSFVPSLIIRIEPLRHVFPEEQYRVQQSRLTTTSCTPTRFRVSWPPAATWIPSRFLQYLNNQSNDLIIEMDHWNRLKNPKRHKQNKLHIFFVTMIFLFNWHCDFLDQLHWSEAMHHCFHRAFLS